MLKPNHEDIFTVGVILLSLLYPDYLRGEGHWIYSYVSLTLGRSNLQVLLLIFRRGKSENESWVVTKGEVKSDPTDLPRYPGDVDRFLQHVTSPSW